MSNKNFVCLKKMKMNWKGAKGKRETSYTCRVHVKRADSSMDQDGDGREDRTVAEINDIWVLKCHRFFEQLNTSHILHIYDERGTIRSIN